MKRLLTVRCNDEDREAIKAIARGEDYLGTTGIVKTELSTLGSVEADAKDHKNTIALLDDNERLSNEIEVLKGKLERCSRASEEEKFRVLLWKYDEVRKVLAKYENDGSV